MLLVYVCRQAEEWRQQHAQDWQQFQGEQCGEGDGVAFHPPHHDLP